MYTCHSKKFNIHKVLYHNSIHFKLRTNTNDFPLSDQQFKKKMLLFARYKPAVSIDLITFL